MPQMTLRISEDIKARLAAAAQDDDRTPHYIALKALKDYLEKDEIRRREIAITEERLRQYELTGKYVSGDEVRAWVDAMRERQADA